MKCATHTDPPLQNLFTKTNAEKRITMATTGCLLLWRNRQQKSALDRHVHTGWRTLFTKCSTHVLPTDTGKRFSLLWTDSTKTVSLLLPC